MSSQPGVNAEVGAAPRVAIVDGASFVLPYDYQLIQALRRRGAAVDFFASTTRYNEEFLDALRSAPGVAVHSRAVSGSVAPRWRGVWAYALMLFELVRQRRRFDVVNLQFSVLWPLEWPLFFWLRRRFVLTLHNAVPHGFRGRRHMPTAWIAGLARAIVFASEATRDDFFARYGTRWRGKAVVLPHGLLPVTPHAGPPVPARAYAPDALVFWSTVKPYKGVELFAELAQSVALRARGVALEVIGAWAPELQGLRGTLIGRGVKVDDGFLGPAELLALMRRDVVFLLPYREASQSGALYSLLHHGRLFICADVGDLGAFMRRFGLGGLLLKDRSAAAVLDCLDHLRDHGEALAQALRQAQAQCGWDRLLGDAAPVYGLPPTVDHG